MDQICTWVKLDDVYADGGVYLGADRCIYFDRYIWLKLGNIMWKKHRSIFQYHVKYIHNDIVKNFRSGILQYAKRVREMHDL